VTDAGFGKSGSSPPRITFAEYSKKPPPFCIECARDLSPHEPTCRRCLKNPPSAEERERRELLKLITARKHQAEMKDRAILRGAMLTEIVRAAVNGDRRDVVSAIASKKDADERAALAILSERAAAIWAKYEERLLAIFRRSKAGQKVGVTEKQGHAWVVDECLDEHQETGAIRKQAGGRHLGIDPTTFVERVRAAEYKLRPDGNLGLARAVLNEARQRVDIFPLLGWKYDEMVGPWNRKGGRSVAPRKWAGDVELLEG